VAKNKFQAAAAEAQRQQRNTRHPPGRASWVESQVRAHPGAHPALASSGRRGSPARTGSSSPRVLPSPPFVGELHGIFQGGYRVVLVLAQSRTAIDPLVAPCANAHSAHPYENCLVIHSSSRLTNSCRENSKGTGDKGPEKERAEEGKLEKKSFTRAVCALDMNLETTNQPQQSGLRRETFNLSHS
jgi:hypothetical protein